jgi:4-amino-4-deoxy-L-arabinose transferase-like glycosyltransferase
MLLLLALAVALTAGVVVRQATDAQQRRDLLLVGGLALGLRLAAVLTVYLIAIQTHGEGVWLNDEASYYLATESLLPNPLNRALPSGLDHLGGSSYLGVTTVIAGLVGMDATSFRLANAAFGACVPLLGLLVANRLFDRRAGMLAGLLLAVFPALVLWSATILRDTLASLGVVFAWWLVARHTRERLVQTICGLALTLVLLTTLRGYLAVAVAIGAGAWLGYPLFARQTRLTRLVVAGLGCVALGLIAVTLARRVDDFAHALLYRQTVTRMETLGKLYRDPPPPEVENSMRFRAGAAVALVDPESGWLLPGLIEEPAGPGAIRVAFVDDTVRDVPDADLIALQSARIPPQQLFAWTLPSLISVTTGIAEADESSNAAWIADALVWDLLLVLAIASIARMRLSARECLYPACIVLGTIAALLAIPGSPGNAERHRATQTVPLLVVLSSGLLASTSLATTRLLGSVSSARSMPPRDRAPAISRKRSA